MKKLMIFAVASLLGFACSKSDDDDLHYTVNENGYIEITSAQHLASIGVHPSFSLDGNYILTEDIDLTGEWTPIGNEPANKAFAGTFDGNNKTIKGLSINAPKTPESGEYMALFSYTKGATIKDLSIENPSVSGFGNIAVLVAKAESTTISNCATTGDSGEVVGLYYIGGLVGHLNSSTLTACYNNAKVSMVAGSISGYNYYVGGVAAAAFGSTTLTDCYNAGSVSSNIEGSTVGGVVGSVEESCSLKHCYNTAEIKSNNQLSIVGGIVGSLDKSSTLVACYNEGSVSGLFQACRVGGVVGVIYNGDKKKGVKLTACYNTGEVSGVSPNADIGGVVGTIYEAKLIGCYSSASVRSEGHEDISQPSYFGGVAGVIVGSDLAGCYYSEDDSGLSEVGREVGVNTIDATPSSNLNTPEVVEAMNTALSKEDGNYDGSTLALGYKEGTTHPIHATDFSFSPDTAI